PAPSIKGTNFLNAPAAVLGSTTSAGRGSTETPSAGGPGFVPGSSAGGGSLEPGGSAATSAGVGVFSGSGPVAGLSGGSSEASAGEGAVGLVAAGSTGGTWS